MKACLDLSSMRHLTHGNNGQAHNFLSMGMGILLES
jgi:hypothetical protein